MILLRRTGGLLLGPALLLLLLALPAPEGMGEGGMQVAAVAALMAVWWLTEAIPIPATALVPIALFPVLGVMNAADVTRSYGNHLIYLFLGGFLIAVTMERWNLHHRLALHTIRLVGVTPRRIVLGFMLATAFLSMWISNTAATMLMITIATAVLHELLSADSSAQANARIGPALVLGIAYGASIGGVATLIGTAPNAILAGVIEKNHGYTIGFLDWMAFGLPLSVTMLGLTWLYLVYVKFGLSSREMPGGRNWLDAQVRALGPMSRQEQQVAMVFCAVAVLWVLNGLHLLPQFPFVRDSTIAVAGALLLFVIPVDLRRGEFLLDWKTAATIPWDIILLFGGGFALADGFQQTGLTHWLAGQLAGLQGVNIVVILAVVVMLVIFLTEVTSNTATASLLLPVLGALSAAIHVHPYGLMVAGVVAASFAFMLPVATPPNAIAYSSRQVTIMQMASAGLWLNLVGVVLITAFVYLLLPVVWGIRLQQVPGY